MRPSPSSMVSRDSRLSSTVTAESDGSSVWWDNEKEQKKQTKTGQVRSDDAKEDKRSFRFRRPDLELDQAGRDGQPADRV